MTAGGKDEEDDEDEDDEDGEDGAGDDDGEDDEIDEAAPKWRPRRALDAPARQAHGA